MQRPKIKWVGGSKPYLLTEDYTFRTSVGQWTVPAGFNFDGASVPRIPFVYARYGNTAQEAACLHDWHYRYRTAPRSVSDRAFLEVMEQFKNPKGRSRRMTMYLAVRSFGWAHY